MPKLLEAEKTAVFYDIENIRIKEDLEEIIELINKSIIGKKKPWRIRLISEYP